MASLVFQVTMLSSAGSDRVNVQLTQVNTETPNQPFFGSTISLNLPQAEADAYEINARYTLTISPEVSAA
jgi:hypothetical protein